MSMIIHSINLILFVVETFLRVALNFLKIRIGELIPSVTNVFNSTMDVQIEVVSGIELDLDYIDTGAGVSNFTVEKKLSLLTFIDHVAYQKSSTAVTVMGYIGLKI